MKILVVYHEKQFDEFVDEVCEFIKGNELVRKERDCLDKSCYSGIDLIVVIGGDGTFLRASHLNKDIPMFGINPNPSKKEGFFMQADSDYKQKLQKVLKKDFEIIRLLRLKVEINGEPIKELALNDVYIGDAEPYNLFNYDIIAEAREFQRSSGILVGTPAGSTAWLKSAGGKKMELDAEEFQYVVREPYVGRLTPHYEYTQGIVETEIKIIPKNKGIVVVDSISKEYPIKEGDVITITKDNYLNYITKNLNYKS